MCSRRHVMQETLQSYLIGPRPGLRVNALRHRRFCGAAPLSGPIPLVLAGPIRPHEDDHRHCGRTSIPRYIRDDGVSGRLSAVAKLSETPDESALSCVAAGKKRAPDEQRGGEMDVLSESRRARYDH